MPIANALAGIAVQDLAVSRGWYEALLESPSSSPMPEVAEWSLPRGGGLQLFRDPLRAGSSSATLAVDDIDAQRERLATLGVEIVDSTDADAVRTITLRDPDDNRLVLAQALDPRIAH
ncbi:VOC family protein [Lysobacter sp. HA35]